MHFNKKLIIAIGISFALNIATNDSFAKITYALDQSVINSPAHKEIDNAMRHAVDTYSAYSDYNIEIPVYYDANVTTANAINSVNVLAYNDD